MSYQIYLGDIDPNNFIGAPIDVRRNIIFKLLLWDNVVMSDSQIITDPRVCHMMEKAFRGVTSYDFKIESWQKDFEQLLLSGLVKVAIREKSDKKYQIKDVWEEMAVSDTSQRIPYLPQTNDYVNYLTKQIKSTLHYNVENLSFNFREILLAGIDCPELEIEKDSVGVGLKKMISEGRPVLFRNLLDYLKNNKEKLGDVRYFQLYDYMKDCYHANLPMALDCYISTKLSDIPFHLGTAEDLNIDERSIDGEKMRPTWVFNPLAIDFLPTEVIPIIKMELAKNNGVTEIVQNMSMGKTPESMAELYDAWETYTAILEKEIVGCLQLTAENKKQLIGQRAHCKNRKYVVEGMKCVLGFFPIIGEIINCFDALKVAWECFSWNVLQKRATKDTPLAHKVAIETYLKTMEVSNVKIITKFDKF